MSTNEPTTDKDSGTPANDRPADCPTETIEATLRGCEHILDRAVTPMTTVRAGEVADAADLTAVQAGYALRALVEDADLVATRLERELDVRVTIEVERCRFTRYRLAPVEVVR